MLIRFRRLQTLSLLFSLYVRVRYATMGAKRCWSHCRLGARPQRRGRQRALKSPLPDLIAARARRSPPTLGRVCRQPAQDRPLQCQWKKRDSRRPCRPGPGQHPGSRRRGFSLTRADHGSHHRHRPSVRSWKPKTPTRPIWWTAGASTRFP